MQCLIFLYNLFRVVQLNSLHSELANQMADSMVFPLIQFREKDLTGRATHIYTKMYHNIFFKGFWRHFTLFIAKLLVVKW